MAQPAQLRPPRQRRRPGRTAPPRSNPLAPLHPLAVTALLVLLLAAAPAAGKVLATDKQALLAFKGGLTESGGDLLSSWVLDSDPCADGWTGVSCGCTDFFQAGNQSRVCTLPPDFSPGIRVLQLNFGDPRITQWNMLTGTIAPALANLTALRVLNFNLNHLYGSLPPELARLTSLEQLSLGGNRLTGSLPAYFSTYPSLRYLALDNNQFTGPLPRQWCGGSWWQFDVQGNAGLCDELPTCLSDRIITFYGTSLIDSVNDKDMGTGGYCGVDPPTCEPELGCRILQPDPPYLTNATGIAFAFSAFRSPVGGGAVAYRWAVGTTRWGRDVLDWIDFWGTNSTQEVATPSGNVTKRVFFVVYLLNQISLSPGQQYYITVQGSNDAGQQLGTMLSSQPMVADVTPPYQAEGGSVYSGQDFANQATQSERSALAASWDPFQDDETGLPQLYYSYQVFQFLSNQGGSPGYVGPAITNKTQLAFQPSQGEFRVYVINLELEEGAAYFMRIYAANNAGLEGFRDAPPVTIVGGSSSAAVSVSKVVILVAVFVGAASAVVALVTYWLMRESMRRHQAARKRMRGQMKNFKYLMQSLVQQVGDAEQRQLDELKQLRELAFVITDLESSTAIAAAAPKQFEKVQEMHDSLLRELIGRYHGYEINTEGDAFHVAFKDVQHAVQFCMEVQYQMNELDWPREVLRLGPCKEVKAPDGSLMFRGPRIRMGVHWAAEGTVVQRLHQITKHRVFTGPAFQVTRELCESAHGGQVLLSHEGWCHLRRDMAAAGFPVVEQLGQYKLDSWPAPIWVYQVTQLLGRPLHRQPPPVNFLEALEAGWGMSITQPPEPRNLKGHLAFVAARLALEACPGGGSGEASAAISKRLHELLATVAMQFGGYIFRLSESQGAYLLSFASAVDAVRFCHSAQALLMYSQWQPDCTDYCGRTDVAPDGKPIFKGPRVAMAVHQSCEFTAVSVPRQQAAADDLTTDYLGTAVERVQQLSDAAHGGQVILSEKAWAAVQDQLPGQPQVVSLGSHLMDHSSAQPPLLLMEVMPQVLSRRTFPPPRTVVMVEPGYRDAPPADEPVAFVYVKVSKPVEVLDAEQVKPAVSDDTIIRVLTAYNMALGKAAKLMRELLRQHRGYECKEPEPGKLTLAFRQLEDAVEWGCAVQQELMSFAWPDTVLEWGECREIRDPENTTLLWRGLCVKVGISYGLPSSKAPLNTGRADYFGSVPNLAARLMAVAQPGQVLVDGRLGSIRDLQWRDDGGGVLLSRGAGPIEFTQLGYLQVKGLDDPKLIFQALPASLHGRQYHDLPATSRTASSARGHHQTPSRMSSISMGLRRQGSVELTHGGGGGRGGGGGLEATPRTASASSMRTPQPQHLKRSATSGGFGGRSRLRANILAQSASAGAAALGLGGRRHIADEHEQLAPGADMPGGDPRSFSVASSGGSLIRTGWLGMLGTRLSGALGRRGASMNPSEMGSSRSATDLLPLTSRSGTTGSNAPSFTVASHVLVPGAPGRPPHSRSASIGIGGLPVGMHGVGSAVGSYASDSTLAQGAAGAAPLSGGTSPLAAPHSGHNSPPLTATRLRDAADWSYPGSTLTTPTTQAAGLGSVDHWDAGLEMEAALGQDGQPQQQAQQQGQQQLPHGHHHQRQPSLGLPPRGPPSHHRSGAVTTLDAALAAAAGGAGVSMSAGPSRESSQAALLGPISRSHSSSSAPAFLQAAAEVTGAAAAAAAAAATCDQTPPRGSSRSGGGSGGPSPAVPPAWQSPARIPPVPPLPLSRLGSASSSKHHSSEELDLLPITSAAASPFGLVPPSAQPALGSRTGSGGGTAGRHRPSLLLDTAGLTFDTNMGLESPDTITPGLQYARQVAQLFVEGRRRSASSGFGLGAGTAISSSSSTSLSSSVAGGGGMAAAAGSSRLGGQPSGQHSGASAAASDARGGGLSWQQQQPQQQPPDV